MPAVQLIRKLFFDFNHFALMSAILAAVQANTVGKRRLVARGALGQTRRLQVIVRAAGGGAALRVPSFWIWHGSLLLILIL